MDLGALVRRLVAGPTGAGGATPSGDSGRAPAPDAPSGNALARPAWRDLPPLQRVVGAAPLVAPNAVFESRLASSRPAPLALAPLGHARGLEAPAGLVSGIAAAVQRAPASPMPTSVRPARAQRGGEAVRRSAAGPAWPESPDDAVAPTIPDVPLAASTPTPGSASELVIPAAASSAFTTAPSPVAGLVGFVGHAAVASASRGESLPATATAASRATPAAPSAPLVARVVASDDGSDGVPITPSSPHQDAATAHGGDRPVRRIRLGAPLTPAVSRMAVPDAPTIAPGSAMSMPTPGMTSEVTMPTASAAASAAGTAAAGPETTALAAEPTVDPLPAPLQVVPLQRTAAAAAHTGPLVGGLRPMLMAGSPALSVSRISAPDAEAEADGSAPTTGPSAALAALSRVDPGAADWAPNAMAGATSNASGHGFSVEPAAPGGISPARLTWSNPMADFSTPPGPTAPPASFTPTAQRAPAAPAISRSAARTGGLRVGPARNGAGVRPSAATVARSFAGGAWPTAASSSGSSPSASPSSSASSSSAARSVSRAVVMDEIDVTPDPSSSAAESSAGEAGAASSGASASEQGAAGAAGGGSSITPSSGGSEAARDREAQVWADRLYDRIALRLRRDLLVERERAGALVDRGF